MAPLEVRVDVELLARTQIRLGLVRAAPVEVPTDSRELWAELEVLIGELRARFSGKAAERQEIGATRQAYRAIGDDPSHYRPANEALLRRVLSGKPLPQINTLVDANTYVSLASGWALGCYNTAEIDGPVEARTGRAGELYEPIGKPPVDAENRLVLVDRRGIFGSPTADSQRTMVTEATRDVLFVIFAFRAGASDLRAWNERTAELLWRYCGGTVVDQRLVPAE